MNYLAKWYPIYPLVLYTLLNTYGLIFDLGKFCAILIDRRLLNILGQVISLITDAEYWTQNSKVPKCIISSVVVIE